MATEYQHKWPRNLNPLSTPAVTAESASVSVSARTLVNAPASLVFDKILRVGDYHEWNTFVPEMRILTQPDGADHSNADILHVGTHIELHAVMDPRRPDKHSVVKARVSDISTPSRPSKYISDGVLAQDGSYTADLSRVYRVAWCAHGGLLSKVMRTERVTEVIIVGENQCEVRSWELQAGLASVFVYLFYHATLQARFADYCTDIKAVCEKDYAKQREVVEQR